MSPPSPRLTVTLLDYLVRAQQDRLRNREPERLRGFEVDHQLESRWLFNGQVGWFGALENLADVPGFHDIVFDKHRPIGYHAAGPGHCPLNVDSRQADVCHEGGY